MSILPRRWADEATLLKSAIEGDARAASALADRLLPAAHALAWRMTGNAAAADDIVQDSFLRLWRAAARWEPRASVGTFFTRIVMNLCYDFHRAQRTLAGQGNIDEIEDIEELSDDRNVDPLEDIAAKRSRAEVREALDRLPARHRAVLVLWAYSDMAVAEIAAAMELTENATHQLLHRARRALKALLMEARCDQAG